MVAFDYEQPACVFFDAGDGMSAVRSLSDVSLAVAVRTVMEEFTPRQMRSVLIEDSQRTLRLGEIAAIYGRSDFPRS